MILTQRPLKNLLPIALTWAHYGELHRVTPWPEVRFERLYGDDWIEITPDHELLEAASLACRNRDWRPYLEFVPADVRTFLAGFSFNRMEALQVCARCPSLLIDLIATPALTAFLSDHVGLRGGATASWAEIVAVHERNGIFGLLEWLGLPASRQTLTILAHLESPDLPKRFLEPLRTQLWEPRTIFALQRMPAITDRLLASFCRNPVAA
ncbi:MAG: hypothetical protein K9M98_03265 [Cephaloticoccus sp.]|nr:hypothetical protein [Cephaloticoccus sp.]